MNDMQPQAFAAARHGPVMKRSRPPLPSFGAGEAIGQICTGSEKVDVLG